MSLSADLVAALPRVEGVLNYLAPMPEKPRSYTYEPPPGVAQNNAVYEPRRLPIHDLRSVADRLSLDIEGLLLVEQRSDVADFYDETELKRIYYPEIEALVADATGAARVIVFDHTIRRRIPGVADRASGMPRQPVPRVHNDYTVKSGPQRVRDLLGAEAKAVLEHRFAVYNLWRPIRGPLRDAPLAICDASSTEFDDFIAADLIYRDRTGETYAVRHNQSHRWFYAPEMRSDEILLFKCYDSALDGRARFAPHSAFADPHAPADMLPRESIEIRTLAFFPDQPAA
jgi:hypothetical protein